MKKIMSMILFIALLLMVAACEKSDDVIVNDLNLGELEHEGISIMGVTYDFYSNGYAAITHILHEHAQISDSVAYDGKSYSVAVLGDIKVNATDMGNRQSVFGSEYSGIKSPANLLLPDSIIYIGNAALANSTAETICLPAQLTKLGASVFSGCKNIESIEWPSGMVFIGGSSLFSGCSNLKTINFPDNCEIYSLDYCFMDCTSLQAVSIPGTIERVGNMTFHNCYELSEVKLGEGIKTIDAWAFKSCPKLTHLVIPESVTTIEDEAFTDCSALIDLTLPDNLMDVSANLFTNTYNLPADISGMTIRVRADMVSYVQSIYPAANVVAK